jgi:hypothetical protein
MLHILHSNPGRTYLLFLGFFYEGKIISSCWEILSEGCGWRNIYFYP